MTVHRPHPLTGPYPYGVEDATGEVVPRHPWSNAYAVPLAERVPLDDSLVYDDPEDALLFDGCDRCAQHASHPLDSVDDDRLAALYREMLRVERDATTVAHYRTRAEATACRHLYLVACAVGRLNRRVDPWTWPWTDRATGRPLTALDAVAPDTGTLAAASLALLDDALADDPEWQAAREDQE